MSDVKDGFYKLQPCDCLYCAIGKSCSQVDDTLAYMTMFSNASLQKSLDEALKLVTETEQKFHQQANFRARAEERLSEKDDEIRMLRAEIKGLTSFIDSTFAVLESLTSVKRCKE